MLRSAALQAEKFTITKFNGFTGTITQSQTTVHSPLLTGTFTLTIGGVPIKNSTNSTDLPYDISAYELETSIRNSGITGFDKVEVSRASSYGCGYSCNWMIKYRGFNQAVPSITVSGASLAGGSNTPTVTATVRRAYSANL